MVYRMRSVSADRHAETRQSFDGFGAPTGGASSSTTPPSSGTSDEGTSAAAAPKSVAAADPSAENTAPGGSRGSRSGGGSASTATAAGGRSSLLAKLKGGGASSSPTPRGGGNAAPPMLPPHASLLNARSIWARAPGGPSNSPSSASGVSTPTSSAASPQLGPNQRPRSGPKAGAPSQLQLPANVMSQEARSSPLSARSGGGAAGPSQPSPRLRRRSLSAGSLPTLSSLAATTKSCFGVDASYRSHGIRSAAGVSDMADRFLLEAEGGGGAPSSAVAQSATSAAHAAAHAAAAAVMGSAAASDGDTVPRERRASDGNIDAAAAAATSELARAAAPLAVAAAEGSAYALRGVSDALMSASFNLRGGGGGVSSDEGGTAACGGGGADGRPLSLFEGTVHLRNSPPGGAQPSAGAVAAPPPIQTRLPAAAPPLIQLPPSPQARPTESPPLPRGPPSLSGRLSHRSGESREALDDVANGTEALVEIPIAVKSRLGARKFRTLTVGNGMLTYGRHVVPFGAIEWAAHGADGSLVFKTRHRRRPTVFIFATIEQREHVAAALGEWTPPAADGPDASAAASAVGAGGGGGGVPGSTSPYCHRHPASASPSHPSLHGRSAPSAWVRAPPHAARDYYASSDGESSEYSSATTPRMPPSLTDFIVGGGAAAFSSSGAASLNPSLHGGGGYAADGGGYGGGYGRIGGDGYGGDGYGGGGGGGDALDEALRDLEGGGGKGGSGEPDDPHSCCCCTVTPAGSCVARLGVCTLHFAHCCWCLLAFLGRDPRAQLASLLLALTAFTRRRSLEIAIFGLLMPLTLAVPLHTWGVKQLHAYHKEWHPASCYIEEFTPQHHQLYMHGDYLRNEHPNDGIYYVLQPGWRTFVTPTPEALYHERERTSCCRHGDVEAHLPSGLAHTVRHPTHNWTATAVDEVLPKLSRRCEGPIAYTLEETNRVCQRNTHWMHLDIAINSTRPCWYLEHGSTHVYLHVQAPGVTLASAEMLAYVMALLAVLSAALLLSVHPSVTPRILACLRPEFRKEQPGGAAKLAALAHHPALALTPSAQRRWAAAAGGGGFGGGGGGFGGFGGGVPANPSPLRRQSSYPSLSSLNPAGSGKPPSLSAVSSWFRPGRRSASGPPSLDGPGYTYSPPQQQQPPPQWAQHQALLAGGASPTSAWSKVTRVKKPPSLPDTAAAPPKQGRTRDKPPSLPDMASPKQRERRRRLSSSSLPDLFNLAPKAELL